jgi:hypothetical protein
MNIVIESKNNKSIENNAAAAITAVNIYNPLFSGINFSNISIPNADLSCALL